MSIYEQVLARAEAVEAEKRASADKWWDDRALWKNEGDSCRDVEDEAISGIRRSCSQRVVALVVLVDVAPRPRVKVDAEDVQDWLQQELNAASAVGRCYYDLQEIEQWAAREIHLRTVRRNPAGAGRKNPRGRLIAPLFTN